MSTFPHTRGPTRTITGAPYRLYVVGRLELAPDPSDQYIDRPRAQIGTPLMQQTQAGVGMLRGMQNEIEAGEIFA